MSRNDLPLLSVELIPKPLFGENLRNRLTRVEWEKCKKFAKEASDSACGVCGGVGAKGHVDCHERWEWIEDGELHVQNLVGLIALCPRCHGAKHYGRTQMMGYADDASDQLMKVNGWSLEELNDHLLAARDQWLERNTHEWTLDLDWLLTTLGITPGPPKETIFSAPPTEPPAEVPAEPLSTAEHLKQVQEELAHLREQLKQARYRVKYAEFWKTKITVPEAGEQRSADAVAEAKEAAQLVRTHKAIAEQLAEQLKRERNAVRTAKRRAKKAVPGWTRDEIELANETAKALKTTRAVILRDYDPVSREEQARGV
ncbi:hypothetical protein ACQCSU_21955 (plasmid) [Pseudarthrobacter sp. O4]|uniref:HNH endonuclease signature motif containing protein n=1 Tax=Pseudarthrobacter sp. O4 TaxID=3418417 RepID=UPI003CEFC85E